MLSLGVPTLDGLLGGGVRPGSRVLVHMGDSGLAETLLVQMAAGLDASLVVPPSAKSGFQAISDALGRPVRLAAKPSGTTVAVVTDDALDAWYLQDPKDTVKVLGTSHGVSHEVERAADVVLRLEGTMQGLTRYDLLEVVRARGALGACSIRLITEQADGIHVERTRRVN